MNALWDKLKEQIYKDTLKVNESKKMTVVIRILSLYLCAFFLTSVIFYVCLGSVLGWVWSIIFILMYLGVFAVSYYAGSNITVWSFMIVTGFWGMMTLKLFGWFSGGHAFTLLLVLIYFFSNHQNIKSKAIIGFFLGIAYYLYTETFFYRTAVIALSYKELMVVRVGCMSALLVATSVIAYLFSRDTQTMERKLEEYNRELEKKANTDALTGLNNRGKGMELLEELKKDSNERIFSVCMCDIDFFKKVNDNYGHDIGDDVLRAVAAVLTRNTKDIGVVSRWGGEEFFIIFPDANGDQAYVYIDNIRNQIKKMVVFAGEKEVRVTLTYGLSEYDPTKTIEENVKSADEKLYYGKEHGRDQIVY